MMAAIAIVTMTSRRVNPPCPRPVRGFRKWRVCPFMSPEPPARSGYEPGVFRDRDGSHGAAAGSRLHGNGSTGCQGAARGARTAWRPVLIESDHDRGPD